MPSCSAISRRNPPPTWRGCLASATRPRRSESAGRWRPARIPGRAGCHRRGGQPCRGDFGQRGPGRARRFGPLHFDLRAWAHGGFRLHCSCFRRHENHCHDYTSETSRDCHPGRSDRVRHVRSPAGCTTPRPSRRSCCETTKCGWFASVRSGKSPANPDDNPRRRLYPSAPRPALCRRNSLFHLLGSLATSCHIRDGRVRV